jgi:nucleotide sugar dehydrogenase
MNICVVALGKIGLPLAVQCARAGHRVRGVDINPDVVRLVNDGVAPFPGEAHLDEYLAEVVRSGHLTCTVDTTEAVSSSDVVIVVVPLMVDSDGVPDFRAMDAATWAIGQGLRQGTLVSYETTLPIGTTRSRFTPDLARISGLTVGKDLLVCHSPERVFSGRIFDDLRAYPKLVGGIDALSTQRAVEVYESILQFDPRPDLPRPNGVWDLGSCEAAEFAKLAETTYRDVNIALANTYARTAEQYALDVYKVIEAANSQPFSHVHQPGVAVGGHCIPVYPLFYLSSDSSAELVRVARSTNASMPDHTVNLLEKHLGSIDGLCVAILGAAYRGGAKETAFSGVFDVADALTARGAIAVVHDPMYTDDELGALGFKTFHFGEQCDAAILHTNHAEYASITDLDLPSCRVIVDGRNVLAGATGQRSIPTITLGIGTSTTTGR